MCCLFCAFSDDYLVQVKAQVMTRDDSKGGWFPMERGGMSRVGLRKLVLAAAATTHTAPNNTSSGANGTGGTGDTELTSTEYHIHGTRIADQTVSTLLSDPYQSKWDSRAGSLGLLASRWCGSHLSGQSNFVHSKD